MNKINTLVHFKLMFAIQIVIISNIVSALWVHSCLHIHHIMIVWDPQNISASFAYDDHINWHNTYLPPRNSFRILEWHHVAVVIIENMKEK